MEGRSRATAAQRAWRRLGRWRRVAGEVRRGEGPVRVLARGAVVVRGVFYRHVVFVALDLTRPLREVTSDLPLEIRVLGPEDEEAYAALRRRPVGVVPLSGRLDQGHVCVAAWLEGRIVSAAWLAFGSELVDEIDRRIELAEDEAYSYDSYTAESHRGRGIAAQRARWSARYLQARGFRRVVGWISPQNRPAFGPGRKLGYETVGIAGYVRIGPWRRDFVQPAGKARRWVPLREPIVVGRDFALDPGAGDGADLLGGRVPPKTAA